MSLKKAIKRDWNWYRGSQEQKELYIKALETMIIEQNKRIGELEKKVNA
ncbi:hypothetical protein [Rossellomorea marisflavi]|nr:hypothetical protein [Rossellomorea marisflavi]